MARITLKGNPVTTSGELPAKGQPAPGFSLIGTDLAEVTLDQYRGRRVVLNIFPSLDTDVCAASVRRFNEEASKLRNSVVLCISRDLPFAQKRFCGAEGLQNVVALSDFRTGAFGKAYGAAILDGPLAGLLCRAVVVLDENGRVTYTQLVPEISQEPDYQSALATLA
jgi:thiol peroxidase